MTGATARNASFRADVRDAFAKFVVYEPALRAEYADRVKADGATAGETLLERVTRRFLIDPVLRALGWDPDDPTRIAEEARGRGPENERFYFDYLGKTASQLPVVIVEAKHCDCDFVRIPHGRTVSAREAARLISAALDAIKRDKDGPLVSEWTSWLKTLRDYVLSLGENGRVNLRRVVIASGSWMVIFEDPMTAFAASAEAGAPDEASIHCFTSRDEIEAGASSILRLLDRERLVDTLSLTLPESDALARIPGVSITRYWRGVIVATRWSGSSYRSYPTRSVYPALVLESASRIFGVARFAAPLEEPRDQDGLKSFLAALRSQGDAFERELLRAFGRLDVSASTLANFPTYRAEMGQSVGAMPLLMEAGLTDANAEVGQLRGLVRWTGEPTAPHEFLVVTGQVWFYKLERVADCVFHSFRGARDKGVAAAEGRFGAVLTSYTETDQACHCEHDAFRVGLRTGRCEVAPIETHLCCKACIYESLCWESDGARRPCPT
ncbi:hypothetical protein [Burkholderia gladioli]|uniref:hypothetical protein n=1 Tax=Burkholderia gladioli TaxID=28095 RepID=UPI001641E155|nr:hypothetical protein [Burkholderia gladioli]